MHLTPVPSRAIGRQRGSAAAWILALLVLGGVAFAVYWFAFRKPGAESSALAARVLPADIELVGGLDLARLVADPDVRALAKAQGVDVAAIEAELAKAGIALGDLRTLVFGGRMGETSVKDALIAVQADSDTKAMAGAVQTLLAMAPSQLRDLVAAGRVETLDGGVVLTGSNTLLDESLAVARGQAAPFGDQPGLSDVRKGLDSGAIFWAAAPIPQGVLAGLPGMVKSALGGTPSHFGLSASLGSNAELRGALFIPGADASKAASALEMLLGLVKSRLGRIEKTLLENLSLSGDGATLIAKISLSQAQITDLLKGAKPTSE